jgi:hypothetical protein
VITQEEAEAKARNLAAVYLEVSAKHGTNIKQIFKSIA